MQYKFPEPEWSLLEEVGDAWGLSVLQVLRYAAEGLLRLHAWSEPRLFPVMYNKLMHGQWYGDVWEDHTPVVVPREAADRLIRAESVDLDEWATKEGEHWSARQDEDGYRCLTVFRCRVFVFREEKRRFEEAYTQVERAFALGDSQRSKSPNHQAGMVHRLKQRRDILDPAIDKAISNAGGDDAGADADAVFLALLDLALNEEKPFTGVIDPDGLCYTDAKRNPAKLSREALKARLKRRRKMTIGDVK